MKIPGYDWPYRSRAWLAFADVLFTNPDEEARSYRADSVFSIITIHRTPSPDGEAYLLVEDNNAEEDNVRSRDSSNIIDLTVDAAMADMLYENDDDDCIIVDAAPRRIPIRPLSVLETPTRQSRYVEQHVQVLE